VLSKAFYELPHLLLMALLNIRESQQEITGKGYRHSAISLGSKFNKGSGLRNRPGILTTLRPRTERCHQQSLERLPHLR